MITSIIEKTVDNWFLSGIIDQDDKDIYVYGLDLLIFTVVNVAVITATAALFGRLPETIMLLIVIMPLQSFGGGYHAKTHLRCFLIMFIGWWGVMFLLPLITPFIATFVIYASIIMSFCKQKVVRAFCVVAIVLSLALTMQATTLAVESTTNAGGIRQNFAVATRATADGEIKGSGVNLRSGPSTGYPSIGMVQNGEKFQWLGISGPSNGYMWYHVKMINGSNAGITGFVAHPFATIY